MHQGRYMNLDKLISKIPPILIQYFIYASIGVLGAIWDIGIFTLLYKVFGIFYLLAFFIGKSFGIVHNFFLNAHFNFKMKDNLLKRFIAFYCIGLMGIGIGTLLMYIAVDIFQLGAVYMNIIVTFFVATVQFFFNRVVSFRKA
jgi:putative flippase GtrA